MDKGRNDMSGPVIFFLCAFALAVISIIVLMRSTDREMHAAREVAQAAEKKVDGFADKILGIKTLQETNEAKISELKETLDKTIKRLEWAEMKASVPTTKIVQAPSTSPIKVEPIQVQVVYREPSKSKPLLPTKAKPDPVAQKVIKSVRQKLKEQTQ